MTELIRSVCLLRMYRFYDLAFWLVRTRGERRRVTALGEAVALIRDIAGSAPRPTLSQRAGLAGDVARRTLWALGHDDHEVFWTRRRWPDQ